MHTNSRTPRFTMPAPSPAKPNDFDWLQLDLDAFSAGDSSSATSKINDKTFLDPDSSSDNDSRSAKGPQDLTSVENRRPEGPTISHDLVALTSNRGFVDRREDGHQRVVDADSAEVSPGDNRRALATSDDPSQVAPEGSFLDEGSIAPETTGSGRDELSQNLPPLRRRPPLRPHQRRLSLNTTFGSTSRPGGEGVTFLISASPRSAASNARRASLSGPSPSLSRPPSAYLENFVFGNPTSPGSYSSAAAVPLVHRRPSTQSALSSASSKVESRVSRRPSDA